VVATSLGHNSKPWEAMQLDLVWRKGKKFRVESVKLWFAKPPDKPAPDTNMIGWWKDRLKSGLIIPQRVCDGEVVWIGGPEDKDQLILPNQQTFKTKWSKFRGVGDGDDFNTWVGCVSTETMPDVMAYGFPPQPSSTQEVTLVEKPPNGPAGCILAERRYTHVNAGNANTYHLDRFWYDPMHAYVMRRFEMGNLGSVNDDAATDTYEAEVIAQTPSGVWYPTCVHRIFGPKPENECYLWYFVDFNAKLPDSLFKPETRTGDIE
jgi:hypothetical protein